MENFPKIGELCQIGASAKGAICQRYVQDKDDPNYWIVSGQTGYTVRGGELVLILRKNPKVFSLSEERNCLTNCFLVLFEEYLTAIHKTYLLPIDHLKL